MGEKQSCQCLTWRQRKAKNMSTGPPGHLTNGQFKKYCGIVYLQCGIKLNDDKKELLSARLGRILRKLGLKADQYLDLIQRDAKEMENFVDAISTNHTFFFREPAAFNKIPPGCRDIWCAASSSGEEPYSLASYCHHLSGMACWILCL